jgi:hypothetical protein
MFAVVEKGVDTMLLGVANGFDGIRLDGGEFRISVPSMSDILIG